MGSFLRVSVAELLRPLPKSDEIEAGLANWLTLKRNFDGILLIYGGSLQSTMREGVHKKVILGPMARDKLVTQLHIQGKSH